MSHTTIHLDEGPNRMLTHVGKMRFVTTCEIWLKENGIIEYEFDGYDGYGEPHMLTLYDGDAVAFKLRFGL